MSVGFPYIYEKADGTIVDFFRPVRCKIAAGLEAVGSVTEVRQDFDNLRGSYTTKVRVKTDLGVYFLDAEAVVNEHPPVDATFWLGKEGA